MVLTGLILVLRLELYMPYQCNTVNWCNVEVSVAQAHPNKVLDSFITITYVQVSHS